jgi:Cu/Ag efflux protein CusF
MTPKRPLQLKTGLALVLFAGIASSSWSANHQAGHAAHTDHGKAGATASAQTTASEMADGEVRRIDKEGGKLTLRHGEIRNLDMPPMTMVFQVKEPALLDKVKVGDKIRFRAEQAGGGYVVTEIEPAK